MARWACVRQLDETDCGAAALATIARHHGVTIDITQVRNLTYVAAGGIGLADLCRAAEQIGFRAFPSRISIERLAQLPMPLVLACRMDDGAGHLVVLHRLGPRRAVIADPAVGVVTWTRAELARRWDGFALVLQPTAQLGVGVELAVSPFGALLRRTRPHLRFLVEAVLAGVLVTALGLVSAVIVRLISDSVAAPNRTGTLNAIAIGGLLAVVARELFGALRSHLVVGVGQRVSAGLSADFIAHLLRLPLSFHRIRPVGEHVSRLRDIEFTQEALGGVATTVVVDAICVAGALALLALTSGKLALLVAGIALVTGAAIYVARGRLRRIAQDNMLSYSAFRAHLVEELTGIATVKMLAAEGRSLSKLDALLGRALRGVARIQLFTVRIQALASTLVGLGLVAVLWFGAYLIIDGHMSLGVVLQGYLMAAMVLLPVARLAQVAQVLMQAVASHERVRQVLELDPEHDTVEAGAARAPETLLTGAVRLERVSFGYHRDRPVIHELDVSIPIGKTTALVGPSGSGKSSVFNLLCRFDNPDRGRILLGERDIRTYALGELRRRVAVVNQEPFLFSTTIAENIAMGNPNASFAELEAAAEAADVLEFVRKLPEQFQTCVGERGMSVSGGERQRIVIARALLAQPEVLLLDEATSHLDSETERRILQKLRGFRRDRTTIIVAHRLSTIADADLILVMERGRVVEQGRHAELLARPGRYARMWRLQTGQPSAPAPTLPAAPPHRPAIARPRPVAPPPEERTTVVPQAAVLYGRGPHRAH
jgi:ATP-binding cassette subfamily B protein